MFGRQIFLEPMDDQREQWRRNECLRQLLATRALGVPLSQLTRIPPFRNDGLTFDLNFIVLEDTDCVRPSDLYLAPPRTSASNQYLLEYIRQMEERYAAMERELTRTKMLLPIITRNQFPAHQTSTSGLAPGIERNVRNQEKLNVPLRKKHHAKKDKDLAGKNLDNADWAKCKSCFQNSQGGVYSTKVSNSNSTATCPENVAAILPQTSTFSTDDARQKQDDSTTNNNDTEASVKNYNAMKTTKSSCKPSVAVNAQKPSLFARNALMETCQGSDKKHEPETLCCIDFDVKHEDHKQTSLTVNASILQPTVGSKLHQDNTERKFGSAGQGPDDLEEDRASKQIKFFENAFARREQNSQIQRMFEDNRLSSNRLGELQQERTRSVYDQPRNLAKLIQKNARGQKKMPTPRSNVHTTHSPIVQPTIMNPLLDPNGMTIRLLRLAVLLYAPALMPALNLLIARQSSQTTIPIPCFEGSNDLLTQLLRILSNQQSVPNLPFATNPRENEVPRSSRNLLSPPRLNLDSPSQTVSKQPQNDANREYPKTSEHEKSSATFNKSLE